MSEFEKVQELYTSFREVNQAFHQSMIHSTQRLGITRLQFFVLKIVMENPGIGLNELSEKIYSVTSTTSGIVDRMVRAGWLNRERPSSNRRSIMLTLTPEGEELRERLLEIREAEITRALAQIPAEDVVALQRIHKQIVNIIQRQREEEEENHE